MSSCPTTYTVKIREGCSILHLSQARVLSSNAFKTGRGRSTFHNFRQARVLPPNIVKVRGGRMGRIIEMSSCPATTTVKLMACHPMQLRQGEDARPSVKLMFYHPTQSRQGEDTRPSMITRTRTRGSPFVKYETSHISEPLFPGGTSVLRIQDITPFECRQTYLVPVLLHDHCLIDKIESRSVHFQGCSFVHF